MRKSIIKKCIFIAVIIIVLVAVFSIMMIYDVEGEKKLPFEVNKIFLVSTVDGTASDDPNNIWNIDIVQVNDLYIYMQKTEENDLTIEKVSIQNVKISNGPSIGKVKMLRPTGDLTDLYEYSKEDMIETGITYLGSSVDDLKSLEISNIGGVMACRFAIEDLGNFVSNQTEDEIIYDGRLLSNLGITVPEIKFDVSMDIVLTTSENVTYSGTMKLNLPMDEVIEKGSCSMEIGDFSQVVFKRIFE